MGVIAVILAATAGFGFGALWYGLLVGGIWRRELGLPEAAIAAHMKAPAPYVVAFAAALLTAGFLRHVFVMAGLAGAGAGLTAGLGAGLFMAAPWLACSYAFAARNPKLALIDGGHVVGACACIGLTLGLLG
ncbi:MAG: hypothetical protein CML46_22060 [Rhodobacteraceae bacterium]|nr:hypothetical protein [Paracoccaceae bacterium]MBR27712.1 hypothetical protein [Paracoccaceae bacterium]MBR29592.1 hypothetical protein [Paracoccaceae bacterium]